MKWPLCRDPSEAHNTNPDGASVEPISNVTPTPLNFRKDLCQGGMKWPHFAVPVRLTTPIRTGAPVEAYLQRQPYAFEVQEDFIIIIFIYCNWVVTQWLWLCYMYTKYEIGY